MKKIGTISAAAGLIYLGVWMIVSKTNPTLGEQIFKWWPIIIVALGIEVLIMFGRKDGGRVGFNFLIIPVLLILLFTNVFHGFSGVFGRWTRHINISGLDIVGMDLDNTKTINTSKTLPLYGKYIYIHANNGSIDVKKTDTQEIKLEGKVYVDDDSFVSKYDVAEKKEADGYTVEFLDNYIKGIKFDLYVPNGYEVKFLVNNLDLKGDEDLSDLKYSIDSDNCNVKINSGSSAILKFQNGNVNIDNTKLVNIQGQNSNVNVYGKSEDITITSNNGKVNVNNESCKNINVDINQGVASVRTDDDNADVKIELQQGVASINGDKSVNSNISRTLGTGGGKVFIKVHQGTASFKN